jgi:cellobiose-specific phosphotransferase system component IIA
MTEIFLYEFSSPPLLSSQNKANCTSRMAQSIIYANTARSAMQVGLQRWNAGDTKGALASCKEARKNMLAAVNVACDAVEFECKTRGKA